MQWTKLRLLLNTFYPSRKSLFLQSAGIVIAWKQTPCIPSQDLPGSGTIVPKVEYGKYLSIEEVLH